MEICLSLKAEPHNRMMKKSLFLFVCLLSFSVSFARQRVDVSADESLNTLIRPFLDSLRVVTSEDNERSIQLVSVFPAPRAGNERFDNFSESGLLNLFTPEKRTVERTNYELDDLVRRYPNRTDLQPLPGRIYPRGWIGFELYVYEQG